jgi:CelD/BcsL family acetyltransferase involved in cellulose biosynthesis
MTGALEQSFDRGAALDACSRLYAQAAPNFFHAPPFLSAWLAAAGENVRLLRHADAIAFVGVRGREVWFGETANAAFDRLYVEYQDFLLAPGAGEAARDAALDALIDGAPEASTFVFRNARPALAAACRRAAERRGLIFRILRTQPTFQVAFAETDHLSASLRAKIRRSIRRYEERGPVSLTPATSVEDRAAAFRELMALHEPYWRDRGEPGAFADPSLRAFHERLIVDAAGETDLLRVTAGAETIGVLYNFLAGGRAYNYQSGFRPEADNQFAPGFTAHALAIDHYRRRGFSVYDLMAGEADYKRRLAREGETLTSLVIERRGVLQQAKSLARWIRRAGTHRT